MFVYIFKSTINILNFLKLHLFSTAHRNKKWWSDKKTAKKGNKLNM